MVKKVFFLIILKYFFYPQYPELLFLHHISLRLRVVNKRKESPLILRFMSDNFSSLFFLPLSSFFLLLCLPSSPSSVLLSWSMLAILPTEKSLNRNLHGGSEGHEIPADTEWSRSRRNRVSDMHGTQTRYHASLYPPLLRYLPQEMVRRFIESGYLSALSLSLFSVSVCACSSVILSNTGAGVIWVNRAPYAARSPSPRIRLSLWKKALQPMSFSTFINLWRLWRRAKRLERKSRVVVRDVCV